MAKNNGVSTAMRSNDSKAPRNVSSVVGDERKNNFGKECVSIIKHFQDKGCADNSFCSMIHLRSDGRVGSVFWADRRSRDSYVQFGDVVVFDMTYRTKKLKFPFVSFLGVNHHRETILFGAALLENETDETFCWVFECFLRCMYGKQPLSIITDQDEAMIKAIKKVFPSRVIVSVLGTYKSM